MVHINVTLCTKLAYNGDGTSLSACIVWRSIDLVSKVPRKLKKIKTKTLESEHVTVLFDTSLKTDSDLDVFFYILAVLNIHWLPLNNL